MNQYFMNDMKLRRQRVQKAAREAGMDGLLLTTDVNIYYLTGLVFSGYLYLPVEGEPIFFVKRPVDLSGDRIFHIRKPEQIPEIFAAHGWSLPKCVLLETDIISYNEWLRLQSVFHFQQIENATLWMRRIRMIKTPWEVEQIRLSASRHAAVYSHIPRCYRPGMTDLQFQIAIEQQMRLHGSRGVFRAFGFNDIFMGSVLAGENAGKPSPFDFALGGGGQTPFCPVGANGTLLKEGMTVMVDMAGNFTDYLSDMTRVFSIGALPELAYRAHQAALDIQYAIEATAKPGVRCADLYNLAYSIVEKAGLAAYYMGTKQQAKFVGHGIGLEINEPPVFTPRSDETLEPHITFAVEPKFVIPEVGAVGIENSYLVTQSGLEKLTLFDEAIIRL